MADDKKTPAPAEPIAGGPGVEPAAPAPKLVTVKHGGRELQVQEDVATAWQEREREFEQRFSRQGAELGELRKRASTPQPIAVREEPREPDIDTLWFENPKAAYQKIKQEVREEITRDYQQDQAIQRFWDGFHRANPDLAEDDFIARAVLRENYQEIADLPTTKAQEKLADLTRERILRLTRKVRPSNDNDRARDLLEPASGTPPARPAAREEDEGPQSISALVRQRNQARQAARSRSA